MNIIVFSKNRALQLELFLRSFLKYWIDARKYKINVLYTFSDPDFERGYLQAQELYPDVTFIAQATFKTDLLNLLNEENKFTVFFVDDDVFKNEFDYDSDSLNNFKTSTEISSLSLRLHPRLNFCYPTSAKMSVPPYSFEQYYTYKWSAADGCFGYPMSLDGHIFQTKDILPLLKSLDYDNPNILEYQLSLNPIAKPYIAFLEKAPIFNNPCNRVQTIYANRAGNDSVSDLNNRFLGGERISMTNLDYLDNLACHQEMEIIFEQIRQEVTVVIPSFNRFDELLKTIKCIKAQTFKDLQIIVVDDGSTDKRYTNSEFNALAVDYYRVDHYGSPSYPRSVGIAMSRGEYVAFCDDDDQWLPEKLEIQISAMKARHIEMSCTEAYFNTTDLLYHYGYAKSSLDNNFPDGQLPEIFTQELITKHNYIINSSVVIHKKVCEKVGVFFTKLANEDWLYWKECLKFTDCLFIVQPLLIYFDSKFSRSKGSSKCVFPKWRRWYSRRNSS